MAGSDLITTLYRRFQGLKASNWRVAVYFPLLALLTSVFLTLSLGGGICIMPLLIPLSMFALPYWFGERQIRNLALVGLGVILVLTLVGSAAFTTLVLDLESPPQSSGGGSPVLSDGQTIPHGGGSETVFRYTVRVQAPVNVANLTVYVNITDNGLYNDSQPGVVMDPVDPGDTDVSDGKLYTYSTTLSPAIHFFHFAASVNGDWYNTARYDPQIEEVVNAIGPVNIQGDTVFASALFPMLLNVVLLVALFYLLLMMYWWVKRGSVIRERRRKEWERLQGVYECTNCGEDVPVEAEVCPHCGAVFEEEE